MLGLSSFVLLMMVPVTYGNLVNVSVSTSQDDLLLLDLVSHILEDHYPECHLSMDTDTFIGPSLQKVFPHQQNRYRPVLVGRMDPTFSVSHQDYGTIWKDEQLYSFRTMPVELKSDAWHGGRCSLMFLLTCDNARNLTLHAVSTFRFRNLIDPLLVHTTNPDHNPGRILLTDPLNGVTFKLLSHQSGKTLKLHNVCYHCHSPEHQLNQPITYPLQQYLETDLMFPEPARNLYGRKYDVAHFEEVDLEGARTRVKDSLGLVSLEEFSLLEMEKIWNLSIRAYVADFALSEFTENGSYTGFTADLVYGRAGASMVQYFTSTSIKATSTYYPHIYLHFSFITRHPRPDIKWYIMAQPYNAGAWTGIFSTIVVCATISYVLEKAERRLSLRNGRVSSCLGKVRGILRELMEQTVPPSPYASVRSFYSYVLLFSIVISCLYKAKIVSLLTFPETEVLPSTFRELHASKMPLGTSMEMKIILGYGVEKSGLKYLKEMYDSSETVSNFPEGFERAMDEDFACVMPDYIFRRDRVMFVDHKGNLKVRWSPEKAFPSYTAPAFPNDEVPFEKARRLILRDRECGFVERNENLLSHMKFLRYYGRARKQALKDDAMNSDGPLLSLYQVSPILDMWVGGLLVSSIAFGFELSGKRLCLRLSRA